MVEWAIFQQIVAETQHAIIPKSPQTMYGEVPADLASQIRSAPDTERLLSVNAICDQPLPPPLTN